MKNMATARDKDPQIWSNIPLPKTVFKYIKFLLTIIEICAGLTLELLLESISNNFPSLTLISLSDPFGCLFQTISCWALLRIRTRRNGNHLWFECNELIRSLRLCLSFRTKTFSQNIVAFLCGGFMRFRLLKMANKSSIRCDGLISGKKCNCFQFNLQSRVLMISMLKSMNASRKSVKKPLRAIATKIKIWKNSSERRSWTVRNTETSVIKLIHEPTPK